MSRVLIRGIPIYYVHRLYHPNEHDDHLYNLVINQADFPGFTLSDLENWIDEHGLRAWSVYQLHYRKLGTYRNEKVLDDAGLATIKSAMDKYEIIALLEANL